MKILKTLKLGAQPLTLRDVEEVARRGRAVELSVQASKRIEKSHQFLISQIQTGQTYYGINTGFGSLSQVKISHNDIQTLQYHLLRSHACGWGTPLADDQVRAMLLLRAHTLALGYSGVSLPLVRQIIALLNHGVTPIVPSQGSVGASGDLAPLAHLALPLVGEGKVRYRGKEMSGLEALKAIGVKPLSLGPKEGLALINGTQFMTAIGALSYCDAQRLCDQSDIVGALSLEALRGTVNAFAAEIQNVRAHPGQIQTAIHMRKLLSGTYGKPGEKKTEISESHRNCGKVQDPYSFRCIPQVHGATRDALSFVKQVLEREINAVTDNPLIFPEEKKILSGGNFHGQVVSMALDFLAIAVAELASISEQRQARLINPIFSDLPAFLTEKGGLNSGFMMVHVASASLVSENKTLCHPACVDSLPTSADKEDHVSMGAWAARKAEQVVANSRRVLAMEFLIAAQGIDFLRPLRSSKALEKIHALIRKKIPKLTYDRPFYHDFEVIEAMLKSSDFEELTQEILK